MQIQPFKLERYFAQYEFKVKYLLSPSDLESLTQVELLSWADAECRDLWESLKLSYTESQGHPRLRDEIAWLYQTIAADQVVVAAPEEAIFIAMHALLQPGDRVVSVFPAYQSLYELARSVGCTLDPWRFALDQGRWRLDLDELERLLSGSPTRLLVLNFPHNPTGYLPDRQELEAILHLAAAHDVWVFSDEMYRRLEYDPADRLPAVCDLYKKSVSLSGLSKAYALPGLRIGWLTTPDPDLVQRLLILKDYTTICSSAPSEILGLIALRAADRILERNLSLLRQNLAAAESFFQRHERSFAWIAPRAGSVAFPRWLGDWPVEQLCQDLVDRRGIMAVPGSIFDFPGSHFRLGLGRKNLPETLAQVEAYLISAQ